MTCHARPESLISKFRYFLSFMRILSVIQAKRMINLLLLGNYRRVQKEKESDEFVAYGFGHSLRSAVSRQWLKEFHRVFCHSLKLQLVVETKKRRTAQRIFSSRSRTNWKRTWCIVFTDLTNLPNQINQLLSLFHFARGHFLRLTRWKLRRRGRFSNLLSTLYRRHGNPFRWRARAKNPPSYLPRAEREHRYTPSSKTDCRRLESPGPRGREIGRVSEQASTKGVRLAEKCRLSGPLFVSRHAGISIHAPPQRIEPRAIGFSSFHRLISAPFLSRGRNQPPVSSCK